MVSKMHIVFPSKKKQEKQDYFLGECTSLNTMSIDVTQHYN